MCMLFWHSQERILTKGALCLQLRNRAYAKVMSAGLTGSGKRWLSFKLGCGMVFLWSMLCVLGVMEKFNKWRIYH